jgi:hypothetical protein
MANIRSLLRWLKSSAMSVLLWAALLLPRIMGDGNVPHSPGWEPAPLPA